MEHKNHDKVFFINFSVVLGILTAIAVAIGTVANILAPAPDQGAKEQLEALTKRIEPVSQAITDQAELDKLNTASDRPAMSGEQVVTKVCGACHGSGMLGAPKTGDKAAWGARLQAQGGADGLAAAAIKGKNAMPPRGGDPSLSDDEIKAAIKVLMGEA